MAKSFRELIAWQKAMSLVEVIYEATTAFPDKERFGLISQLQRAAVSVPCNIAEGQGRLSMGEFIHFLGIARGSLLEVETLLDLSRNLRFLAVDTHNRALEQAEEVARILNGLMASLQERRAAGTS